MIFVALFAIGLAALLVFLLGVAVFGAGKGLATLAQTSPIAFTLCILSMSLVTYLVFTNNNDKPTYHNGEIILKPGQCIADKHTPKYGPRCKGLDGIEFARDSDFLPIHER